MSATGAPGSETVTYPVTEIKERAFTGHQGLISITIPASVTSVNYTAFQACNNLKSITYLGTANPISGCSTMVNPNCVLYVPNATSGFSPPQCWGATDVVYGGSAPVVEERTETTAVVTWNLVENAVSYYLYLYADASKTVEIAVYEFDADGNYVGRLRSVSETVPTFNLTGLEAAESYYAEVEAKNEDDEVLLVQSLAIPTLEEFDATGINKTNVNNINIYSSNGTITIDGLNSGDMYNIINTTGMLISRGYANKSVIDVPVEKGVYIVMAGSKTVKVVVF